MTGSLTGLPTKPEQPALMSTPPPLNETHRSHPPRLPNLNIVCRSAPASRPYGRYAVALRASPDPDALIRHATRRLERAKKRSHHTLTRSHSFRDRDRPGGGTDLAHKPRDHGEGFHARILSDYFAVPPTTKTQVTGPTPEVDLQGGTSQARS